VLTHTHNPAEILQFTGGWLITNGIAAGGFIVIYLKGKGNTHD